MRCVAQVEAKGSILFGTLAQLEELRIEDPIIPVRFRGVPPAEYTVQPCLDHVLHEGRH
jgi:hypothetical protein